MLLFLQILHFTSLTIRYHVLISLYSQFSYLALFSRILLNEKTNRRLSYNLACSQLTTALCLERQNWSAAISDAHARQPQSAASARRGAASARRRRRLVYGAALSAESMQWGAHYFHSNNRYSAQFFEFLKCIFQRFWRKICLDPSVA